MTNYAWLTPEGKLIEITEGNHFTFAEELLEEEMGIDKLEEIEEELGTGVFDILHQRGWFEVVFTTKSFPPLCIGGSLNDEKNNIKNIWGPEMNEAQLKVAHELCEKYKIGLETAVNGWNLKQWK